MPDPKNQNEFVDYQQTMEPIVLSKPLLELLIATGDFANLLALYSFYYYTAKWQQTNSAYATISYVSNKLGWGVDKIREKKKKLVELGLIEETQTRTVNGVYGKRYIQVKFIWMSQTVEQVINHGPGENTQGVGVSRPCVFHGPGENTQANALSTVSSYALSTNNTVDNHNSPIIPKRTNYPKTPYQALAEQLAQIVESKRKITITTSQITSWSKEIQKLCNQSKINPQRVHRALDWYSDKFGEQYIPVIQSGGALREKFIQLESAIERTKQNNAPARTSNNSQNLTGASEKYEELGRNAIKINNPYTKNRG